MNSLSKWVRGKLQHYDDCHEMINDLGRFTVDMKHFMEDRRREMEEKQAARREVEERKKLEELQSGDADAASSLKVHSKYFDLEQSREGSGDTAWTSPRIAATLAKAKTMMAMEEKEKTEKENKRTEIANLDNKTHLQKGLDAASLLNSFNNGSHPSKTKTATSVINISSSSSGSLHSSPRLPVPSETKMRILPPKLSRKSKKMEIISDDEETEGTVVGPDVTKISRTMAGVCCEADFPDKPVTVEVRPGKFVEVEPSKPTPPSSFTPSLNDFSFKPRRPAFKDMREQTPSPTTQVTSALGAHQSSNVRLSESSKRKKSVSPECEAGPPRKLVQTNTRPWEDQNWLEQPERDFEKRKSENVAKECDFDLGGLEEDFDEASSAQEHLIQNEPEWPEEDLNFDDFAEDSNFTTVTPSASSSSLSTTPRPTSVPFSVSHKLQTSEAPKTTDQALIDQMLKRRARSGQFPATKGNITEANVVPETPEDDSIVIFDDEESIWGSPQEFVGASALATLEPEVERSRPVCTSSDNHRMPLFGKHVEEQKSGANGLVGEREKERRSSGEGEEVVLPEQIKPSLSSEDDIDEPAEEELVVRKKVVKNSQASQRRPRKPKTANKQRPSLSMSMRRENSDDDFL